MPRGAGGGMGGGMGGGRSLGGGHRGGVSGGGMGGRSSGGMGGRPPGGGMPRGGGGSGAGGFFTGMLLGNMMGSSRGGGGGSMPPQNQNNNQNSGGGFGSGCAVIIIAIVLIIVVFGLFGVISGGSCSSSDITASTVEREKLPAGSVNETGYYTDEGGWGINERTLESGMKSFYDETGVQPYLYLLDDGYSGSELQTIAGEAYDELFTDEGHFLLAISDDGSGYGYYYGDAVGSQAKTVMDSEAIEIVLDYIDEYYISSSSTSDVFSKAFENAGKRIMTRTTQPIDLVVPIVICIVIVIVAIIIFITLRRRRQHETEERERTERILSTPLEKYEDPELEDLEKKYEKSSSDTDSDVKVSTSEEAKDESSKTNEDKDVEDLAKEYEEKDGESQTGDE